MPNKSFGIIGNVTSTQNGTKQIINTRLLIKKKKKIYIYIYKKYKKKKKKISLTMRQSGVNHQKPTL